MGKKAFYYSLLAVFTLTGVIALLAFFNAWTFAPHVAPHAIENKAEGGQKSYVAYAVSNGWHVGLVVPAGRINALLPDIKKRFEKTTANSAGVMQEANYYEIGWGDRGFYEAKEITTLMAVQAMFNSPGSVMHVVAVHNPLSAFGKSQLVKFCLNETQLASLETFIVNSFAKHAHGGIVSRRPGLYGDSQFFEAAGTYHFLNSCNTWAAKALRSAGFDIKPTFKLFASQVMNNIDVPACQAAM
jgi:uncharacterized protein (TIGR02117 family)